MSHPPGLLAALHVADSAFPSGGFAFSWGLEGLAADGLLTTSEDVEDAMEDHLLHRWTPMDRILLREAFAVLEPAHLVALDRRTQAATLSEQMRLASVRAGPALLDGFARLGYAAAVGYREVIGDDPGLGHLPVVQGLTYREAGLGLGAAEAVSGWTAMAGLASAAIRLGLIGHIEAQHILSRLRQRLDALLRDQPSPGAPISSFTPLADIAVSRGPGRHLKMFAT